MSKIDGVQALEKIIEFDADAEIIMISAVGRQDLVKQARMAGAKNYIIKPLDRSKVLKRISTVLGD